jgi:hypothetical protein
LNVAPSPRATSAPPTTTRAWRRVAALAIGDALSFVIFAWLGRGQHHEATGLAAVGQIALTAVPFALGWFAVAPFVGAFRSERTDSMAHMARTTLLAWLAVWPATLLLRWGFTGRVPPVSFALVILLANAILLTLWRGAFAFWERRNALRQ